MNHSTIFFFNFKVFCIACYTTACTTLQSVTVFPSSIAIVLTEEDTNNHAALFSRVGNH